jgi:hypothetical protein
MWVIIVYLRIGLLENFPLMLLLGIVLGATRVAASR